MHVVATVRLRPSLSSFLTCNSIRRHARHINMAVMAAATPAAPLSSEKREGDISDAFASMSGSGPKLLPDRYRLLKLSLVAGHEAAVVASWERLLRRLRTENERIAALGPRAIPAVRFGYLDADLAQQRDAIRTSGVAVVRGVLPAAEARGYKDAIEAYVAQNAGRTRGFPPEQPQVLELYWSAPQLQARAHTNLLAAQRALLQLWHTESAPGTAAAGAAAVDLVQPLAYADRLRIRQPGDARFALGPHQDGGSVERWEPEGYGTSGVYDAVFRGTWDAENGGGYDPWDAGRRAGAVNNRYNGLGACSAFRAFQGWLSMSHTGPNEGTLLVYPLAQLATVYTLLRPFFRPLRQPPRSVDSSSAAWLDAANWAFTGGDAMTAELQGATPGQGQEFPDAGPDGGALHPHLELARTMVHVPAVAPGDYVVWHCDTIHAVDRTHRGRGDASVLYIPVCPVTAANAQYLARQRAAFLAGTPAPDFPGGKGESAHVGRPTADACVVSEDGRRAMGLAPLATDGLTGLARAATETANAILGF